MRILVCHPRIPFMRGGADAHVQGLVTALGEAGHQAESVTLPFKWYPAAELVHQMGMWRSVDLTESNGEPVDLVIALKFPAYLVRHPDKVIWLIHQQRTAYELWDHPEFGDLAKQADGLAVRSMIHAADRLALGEARRIFTNSENVRARLQRSTGLTGDILYHRSPMTQRLLDREPRPLGDYVLIPGRMEPLKRPHLAVEAMRHVRSDVRVLMVGEGPDRQRIVRAIDEAGLGDRMEIRNWVSDDELADLYQGALAVFYGPWDEDYGYVTIEAMAAARPAVVTTDSGGPVELVRDEETGLVVPPDPRAIAAAVDRLHQDRSFAERMGDAGRTFVQGKIPGWAAVARRLVA